MVYKSTSSRRTVLSASIVLYKNDKTVSETIRCVLKSTVKPHLYLIDNSPTDSLKVDLAEFISLPNVEYIFNKKNIGFGSAHNIAFKKAFHFSDYHLILNPDVLFDENVISSIYEYAKKDKSIGLIMPKVLNPDGTIQYLCKLLPTPADLLIRRLPFFTKKFKQDSFELRFTYYNKIMEVPFLSGCFMFISNECIKTVHGFDDRFFMYGEDIDFSRRIHDKFKTIYYPEVSIIHGYAKGSYKNVKLFLIHLLSIVKYFNKWGWFFDAKRKHINETVMAKLINN